MHVCMYACMYACMYVWQYRVKWNRVVRTFSFLFFFHRYEKVDYNANISDIKQNDNIIEY
jgi:hypothetical protein